MAIPSVLQLAQMVATNQAHMMDECVHELHGSTTGTHGEPVTTFSDGDTLICNVDVDPGKELTIGQDAVKVDATFYLPVAAYTDIGQADRLRLTKRFGVALATAETYEVIGLPARGASDLALDCKRIVL